MRTRLTPIEELSEVRLAAWRDLATRSVEPNPFFEPEFVLPAVRHLDARRVALLTVERDGDLLACMPVRQRGRGPWRSLTAWRHPYTFLGTPLVDDRDPTATLETLFRVVALRGPGLLTIDQLAADGPIAASVDSSNRQHHVSIVQRQDSGRAALTRATALAGLDTDRRQARDRRRRRRMLGEDLGGEVTVTDHAGSAAALDEFLRLEGAGWKGAGGTALASSHEHAAFFREIAANFAALGRLQLLALGTDERTAAMNCNLIAGDTIFCFKLAFDEELRRGAPGVLLVHANGEVFRDERTERLLDSCAAPGNQMLNRLWPDRRPLWRLVASPPGTRSVLARERLRIGAAAHRQAHKAMSLASGAKPTNV